MTSRIRMLAAAAVLAISAAAAHGQALVLRMAGPQQREAVERGHRIAEPLLGLDAVDGGLEVLLLERRGQSGCDDVDLGGDDTTALDELKANRDAVFLAPAVGLTYNSIYEGAAFGLTVTLVWLYIEILRILAILRGN